MGIFNGMRPCTGRLGGARFEFRVLGFEPLAPLLQMQVLPALALLSSNLHYKLCPQPTILATFEASFQECDGLGLFSQANGFAPAWKRLAYHRLLALLGFTHPVWSRTANNADLADLPWGPGGLEVDPATLPGATMPPPPHVVEEPPFQDEGGQVVYSQGNGPDPSTIELPPDIPIIRFLAEGRVGPAELELVPLEMWTALATHFATPHLDRVWHDVAMHTSWRKWPRGRGRPPFFSWAATPLGSWGGAVGPLGTHLVVAVLTLVYKGAHHAVKRVG